MRAARKNVARRLRVCYCSGMDGAKDMGLGLDVEDLDVDLLSLARPGRRQKPLSASFLRPIRESDLARLATDAATPAKQVQKLKDRHHSLARLLASGVAEGEAAIIVGYDLARVSVLKSDPAFSELVSFYREKVDVAFAETMDQLAGLNRDALLELRERIENEPEKFSNEELRKLLETSLDRSGYGPTHKQETTVNISLSEKLESARKRALEARRAQIIDAEVVENE